MSQNNFGENPVIGYLNLNDPEEKKFSEELDESQNELRKQTLEKYPTPDSAIEPYRQGYIQMYDLEVSYLPQEVEYVLDECRKRNEADKVE